MFYKSRLQVFPINRNTLIAAAPLFFLVLLGLWTLLNVSVSSVKADPSQTSAYAIVKRASANLREGPGFQYRILGRSLKGATLTVVGKYDNEFGQRWYKVYLSAFGDVWVSGTVVTISPANANIPTLGLTSGATAENTSATATTELTTNSSTSTNNSNNSPNNPPNNPPPQPTAAPGPATTPEVHG
jgi:uncharacterized protein YgiM (DUF1202 family)